MPPSSSFLHAALPFLRVRVFGSSLWLTSEFPETNQTNLVCLCLFWPEHSLSVCWSRQNVLSECHSRYYKFQGRVGGIKVLTTRRLTRPPKNSPLRAWDEGILRNTRKRADSPITWKEKKEREFQSWQLYVFSGAVIFPQVDRAFRISIYIYV